MGALLDHFKSKRNRENFKAQRDNLTAKLNGAQRLLWCIIAHRHNGKIIITPDELRRAPVMPELASTIDKAGRIHFEAVVKRGQVADYYHNLVVEDVERALL